MPKFTRKTIIFYRKALHSATDWQFNPALRYIYPELFIGFAKKEKMEAA